MNAKGKMKKTGNPFIGKPLFKIAATVATANFNYDNKVAGRDGERGEQRGSWHTVVLIGNKLTPVSVHKDDIVTTDAVKIADRKAVLDETGSVQFTTDEPRLLLAIRDCPRSGRQGSRVPPDADHEPLRVGRRGSRQRGSQAVSADAPAAQGNTDMQLTALDNLTQLVIGGTTLSPPCLKTTLQESPPEIWRRFFSPVFIIIE